MISKKDLLSDAEIKYLNLFGELYKKRGQTNALGVIYALLAYKANNEETGLTQQEISNYTKLSVSTVSRSIKQLVDLGFCKYSEVINDDNRPERKYFMEVDTQILIKNRFLQMIKENQWFKFELNLLRENLSGEDNELSKHLVEIEKSVDNLIQVYRRIIEISKESVE